MLDPLLSQWNKVSQGLVTWLKRPFNINEALAVKGNQVHSRLSLICRLAVDQQSFLSLRLDLTWSAKGGWPFPSWQHYFVSEYRLFVKVQDGRTTSGYVKEETIRKVVNLPYWRFGISLKRYVSWYQHEHKSDKKLQPQSFSYKLQSSWTQLLNCAVSVTLSPAQIDWDG